MKRRECILLLGGAAILGRLVRVHKQRDRRELAFWEPTL